MLGLMRRAAIVGAGPNGLSAAITLARAGVATTVFEAAETVGGAARTAELTLPGFRHDVGSSVYPFGVASPFFRELPLERFGLRWIEPGAAMAHPLDDGTAVMLEHSIEATAAGLGVDGDTWRRLIGPLVEGWPKLCGELLGPVVHVPRHPLLLGRFGLFAMLPATALEKMLFRGERARALFAGCAAHSVRPLESVATAAVGLVFAATAHAVGWPIVEGGAQALSDALAKYFVSLGGEIRTGTRIADLRELGDADAILCDVSPRQLRQIAGERLSLEYAEKMERFAYGPGVFKVDWALSGPIPWRAKECLRAATVHVGGTMEEIAAAESAPWGGEVAARPFVLVTQPSLFDVTRAPAGKHTAWAYCHVPNGWEGSAVEAIEAQVERFAPGFRECVLARHTMGTRALEQWDANLIGGDISGGAMTLGQMVARPAMSLYRTGTKGLYLCSASTPPGGGVHGMCGHLAALRALEDLG
ncbi:MAG TPA: NAD(P)/FAD-dependent oxidoreductase [Edaphobacter sp.]|uniref:phytoene desaturase family protein n=1 Tax=Edaphobacter sp. TaxID=1934404 RepID=UPI002BC98B0F|nr:NAD(P)/FAD-dependent oxidoreductase [Edaphobacter sp.]HUZ97028.1 NAD(P)/FAD-dependent oxidoreductase [Edaphobacter sp.]